MEERPCNQGYVLGINARRAAELFYTRLLPETRATFVGKEVRRRFSEQNLPAPHYRTVRKRIEALDLRLAMQKREGVKKAREKLGPVSISTLMPKSPMDVLQIDHTLVDVIVVELRRRYASALLHYRRKHIGPPRSDCGAVRDLSATKQLSSPYFGI
jgi:hypothetical protein